MKKKNPADATFRNINALKKRGKSLEDWARRVDLYLTKLGLEVAQLRYDAGLNTVGNVFPAGFCISPNPGKQEKNMAKKKSTKKGGKKSGKKGC